MADIFYNGQDDLTGALGYEKDGVTTVVFRRSLKSRRRSILQHFIINLKNVIENLAFEQSDHSIVDEPMMLIWAVGQTHGSYSHKPDSGLEKGNPSVPDFYMPDQVTYHGKENRGFAMVNFFGDYHPLFVDIF